MEKSTARHVGSLVLGLLSDREKPLFLEVVKEINRFPFIEEYKNTLIREKEMNRHYDRMFQKLDEARLTNNLAMLMGVEYAMLERDEATLKQIAERHGMDKFLKGDMTTNQKCREAVGGALEALQYQAKNFEQFHEVMNIGCPRENFDAQNLPIDVVRDAARTQANSLRNDMKGLIQTDQELRRRNFLSRRHENLVTSKSIYRSIQLEAERNRDTSHALF